MMTRFKLQVERQITQKAVTKEAVLLTNMSSEVCTVQCHSPRINLVLMTGPLSRL